MTLDICPKHSPVLCTDLLEWDLSVFPPDYFAYIHASCPCENYSCAKTTGGPRQLELADALVEQTLARVRDTARSDDNLVPPILEAVKAYASEGELCDVLRDIYGTYHPDSLTTGV